jgi:hypothetical protein
MVYGSKDTAIRQARNQRAWEALAGATPVDGERQNLRAPQADSGRQRRDLRIPQQELCHEPRSFPLHVRCDVRIDVEGDRDGSVTEHLGDYLGMNAATKHQRRRCVAEVMEADNVVPHGVRSTD